MEHRDGKTVHADVSGGLQIDNGEALRVATLEGAGISYEPVDLVRDDLASGRLVRVLPDWGTLSIPIQLIYPSRRVPRRVSVLMDQLVTEIGQTHPMTP